MWRHGRAAGLLYGDQQRRSDADAFSTEQLGEFHGKLMDFNGYLVGKFMMINGFLLIFLMDIEFGI